MKKSHASDSIMTYTFHCTQLDGEQTNNKTEKRWACMTMERYKCSRWVFVTLHSCDGKMAGICMTHYWCHPPYTNISISEDVAMEIEKLKDLTAANVSHSLGSNLGLGAETTMLDMAGHSEEIPKDKLDGKAGLCALGPPSRGNLAAGQWSSEISEEGFEVHRRPWHQNNWPTNWGWNFFACLQLQKYFGTK